MLTLAGNADLGNCYVRLYGWKGYTDNIRMRVYLTILCPIKKSCARVCYN